MDSVARGTHSGRRCQAVGCIAIKRSESWHFGDFSKWTVEVSRAVGCFRVAEGCESLRPFKIYKADGQQEVIEASRPPSPRTANHSGLGSPTRTAGPSTFPFSSGNPAHSSQHLLGCLPPRDEAETLIDSYFRYFGWSYVPSPYQQRIQTDTQV